MSKNTANFVLRFSPGDPPLAAMAAASMSTGFRKKGVSGFSIRSVPDKTLAKGSILEARSTNLSLAMSGTIPIARCIARYSDSMNHSSIGGGKDPAVACEIERIIQFATNELKEEKLDVLKEHLVLLDAHMSYRSVMAGTWQLTIADGVVWETLTKNPDAIKIFSHKKKGLPNLMRWWNLVDSAPQFAQAKSFYKAKLAREMKSNTATKETKTKAKPEKTKKNAGEDAFNIPIQGAKKGQVVTRFPPEPSGYMHIGHAKAALLNDYFAKRWEGKCLLRFDDTNPAKEKQEYVDNIISDLKKLGVKHEPPTCTSDHFETILKYADVMLAEGKAYIDDTPQETMQKERKEGIESASRKLPYEEQKRRWVEMKKGTEYGLKLVMRAKIDMQHGNKCMRDPAMYRCKLEHHHKTGDKYKVYPTYDFACPIVDSVEGVTHALRTVEYKDREQQYNWFINALRIRKPAIWTYSRLNFQYTVLSKRKLKWFVDSKTVEGWNDPRFPTVQGVLRRGLTVAALREFVLSLGASQSENMMSWAKIWAINKKKIDPVAHRFLSISGSSYCKLKITNLATPRPTSIGGVDSIKVQLHPKYKEIGYKSMAVSENLLLDQEDLTRIKDGETVVLMRMGCCTINKIERDSEGKALSATGELALTLSPKDYKNRITWVASSNVPVTTVEFDQLMRKPKLEEGDEFKDWLTPTTRFETKLIGESALKSVKEGQIIQLERRGFFRCDSTWDSKNGLVLFDIPTGKAKSMSSFATKVEVKNN